MPTETGKNPERAYKVEPSAVSKLLDESDVSAQCSKNSVFLLEPAMEKINEDIPSSVKLPKVLKQGWRSYLGILLTIIASALYTLGLILTNFFNNYNSYMINFWRFSGMMLIVPFVIYARLWKHQPIFKSTWPVRGNLRNLFLLMIVCISGTAAAVLQVYSIQHITLADSSTITFSTPVFVTIASHWILREKTGIVPIFCGLVTLLGVVVITRPPFFAGRESFDTDILIGAALATGSMVSLGVFFVTLRGLRHMHYAVIMLFGAIWGTLQSLVACLTMSHFELPIDLHDWLLTGAVALLYFLPEVCITLSLKYEEAGIVSLFQTFDILFAFIWQYLLMGMSPDWISVLGGFVVVSGVLLAALRKYIDELPSESPLKQKMWFVLK